MAITSGICISFRKEIMLGEHDLDTDAIKLALYTSAASLSDGTTAYTVTNEVVGTGYSAGGVTLDRHRCDHGLVGCGCLDH
jgi:hypothetical protein